MDAIAKTIAMPGAPDSTALGEKLAATEILPPWDPPPVNSTPNANASRMLISNATRTASTRAPMSMPNEPTPWITSIVMTAQTHHATVTCPYFERRPETTTPYRPYIAACTVP